MVHGGQRSQTPIKVLPGSLPTPAAAQTGCRPLQEEKGAQVLKDLFFLDLCLLDTSKRPCSPPAEPQPQPQPQPQLKPEPEPPVCSAPPLQRCAQLKAPETPAPESKPSPRTARTQQPENMQVHAVTTVAAEVEKACVADQDVEIEGGEGKEAEAGAGTWQWADRDSKGYRGSRRS